MSDWEPYLGAFVWAKLPSYPWWPGVIAPDAKGNHRKGNRFNVNFFNDSQHAWVTRENLVAFAENMDKCVKPTHRFYDAVRKAIAEAIEEGALSTAAMQTVTAATTDAAATDAALTEAASTLRGARVAPASTASAAAADHATSDKRAGFLDSDPSEATATRRRLKQRRKIPAEDSDGTETAASSSEYAVSEPEHDLSEGDDGSAKCRDAYPARIDEASSESTAERRALDRSHDPNKRRAHKRKSSTGTEWTPLSDGISSGTASGPAGASPGSLGTGNAQQVRMAERSRGAGSSSHGTGASRTEHSRQLAALRQQNAQMKARLALLERKLEKYPPAPPEPTPLTLDAIRASATGLTSRRSIGAEDLTRVVHGLEERSAMLSELHQAWSDRCSKYRECAAQLEDLRLAAARAAEAFELEERRIALQLAELLRYQVTLEVLRTSRAGKPIKTLGRSLHGKSAVIGRLAEEIVSKWKAIVTEAQRESQEPSLLPTGESERLQTRDPSSSGSELLAAPNDATNARSGLNGAGRVQPDDLGPSLHTTADARMDVHGSVAGVADAAGREGAFAAVQQVATETGSFDAGPVSTLESAWNTANATEVDGDQQQQQHSDRMQTEPMVSALPLPPGKRGDIVRALTDVFIAAATEEATPTEHVNAATINLCRSLCIELERALNAKFSFDFARPDYSAKYRELKANLRRNADLRWRLLRQELSPAELVDMSAEALKTEQAREREAEIAERMLFHKQRGIPQAASTDQFRCGKCGQRSCTYFQMQTRSADEPMTTFVTCTHCGNRWKC